MVRAISFPQLSVRKEEDSVQSNSLESPKSVIVGEEKFVLSHVQDAQVLCTMIEATTFNILGRQTDHFSLEDLKAYVLLTAVKNQLGEAVVQIRQEITETGNIAKNDQKESLSRLAVSMASQWVEGSLFQYDKSDLVDWTDMDDRSKFAYLASWNRYTSLFDWAVICNYTTLTEFLVSEKPAVDEMILSLQQHTGMNQSCGAS